MGQLMLRGKLDVHRIQGNDARQRESAGRVLPGLSLPHASCARNTIHRFVVSFVSKFVFTLMEREK